MVDWRLCMESMCGHREGLFVLSCVSVHEAYECDIYGI